MKRTLDKYVTPIDQLVVIWLSARWYNQNHTIISVDWQMCYVQESRGLDS